MSIRSQRLLDANSCSGVSVATTDDELALCSTCGASTSPTSAPSGGGAVVDLPTALNGTCQNTDLRMGSMLLVLKAGPPVVGVEADGRALALVAPEAPGE